MRFMKHPSCNNVVGKLNIAYTFFQKWVLLLWVLLFYHLYIQGTLASVFQIYNKINVGKCVLNVSHFPVQFCLLLVCHYNNYLTYWLCGAFLTLVSSAVSATEAISGEQPKVQ